MYQHIWFNSQNFTGVVRIEGKKPANWIEAKDIESVLLTCWCEHCLECAVPLCYQNCENWVERLDKKCQKTFYGTYLFKHDGEKVAQLKFRKWGKIEACINPSSSTYNHYGRLYSINVAIERIVKPIALSMKWLSPTLKLCGAQHVYRDKFLKAIKKKGNYNAFLVQCYSPADFSYNMVVEFYTPEGVFYRNSIPVSKGYNQTILDIDGVDLQEEKMARARIYPENNIEQDIVLFKSDFVRINPLLLPQKENNEPAKKIKCIAWDLDNTVWDGVLIEADPDMLQLKEGVKELMKSLDERGIIQIVVSKNDEDQVVPVLKRLGIYDMFVYVFANWNAKSDNLKQAAALINININTFGLIDDSSYERGEVSANIPVMRVYKDTDIPVLLTMPEFDVPITEDGKKRRQMYQTEVQRRKLQMNFQGTSLDFLKSCELLIELSPITEESFYRSYELVQRTNQLNLSGIKYTKEDFRKLCFDSGYDCYVAHCSDKYGDYGQVGFMCVTTNENTVVISEYAMSCRVASKWLEPRLIQWLCEYYNKNRLVFKGVDSKKNGLLIRTLTDFGLENHAEAEGELLLEIERTQMDWPEIVSIIYKDNNER